jgi:tetratricopeptide (TPR) repeat protein
LFDVEDEREAALFEAWEAEKGAGPSPKAGAVSGAQRASDRAGANVWLDVKSLVTSSPKAFLYAGAGILLLVVVVVAIILLSREKVPAEVLEQAASYLDNGQHQQAAGAYSAILASYGEYAPAYLGRGRAQLASGNLEAGIADLTRAVELDPKASALAEELADVLFTHGRFQEAVTRYQQALASGDISAQAHYRLASSLVQLDLSDEALPQFKSALEKDPSHEEARLYYAKLLNANGRYAEAEETLRSAKSRIDSDFFNELGTALLEQEKLDEAEEVARSYMSEDPETARPHALLGEIYLRRKQFDPARRELIRALRIDPEEPRAQIALGKAWLAIGQTRGDRGDLAKARRILVNAKGVPEGERLLVLGQVSLAEGNVEDATKLLDQALSKGANPFQVRLSLARAKYAAEDLAGAAEELQRAGAFAPSDPALALSLGLVYSELDDPRRAAEEYLTAIQGIGLTAPPEEENGPVVLPQPYVPLPTGFDLNRTIRSAYRQALSAAGEEDPTAAELKTLAESTSFVIAGGTN